MSLSMQVKLLRALQEKKIRPVGSVEEIPVQVRVLAATNRDLLQMIQDGTFREDLYYRLATVVIRLPPLRERREDVPLLVRHILQRTCRETSQEMPRVDGQAMQLLMTHSWPGNIRQLENVLRAALVMSDRDITVELLASLMPTAQPTFPVPTRAPVFASFEAISVEPRGVGRPRKCTWDDVQRALELCHQNRNAAARMLGISPRTLQRYIRKNRSS